MPKKKTPQEKTRYVVAVKPGSAAGKPWMFELPAVDLGKSVKEAITYGMGLNHKRAAKDIVDATQREMNGTYGIVANGETVKPEDKIRALFVKKLAPDKTHYHGVDLIVSSKQTGGFQGLVARVYE